MAQWFLLLQTQHAGTKWFAAMLRKHTPVYLWHNVYPEAILAIPAEDRVIRPGWENIIDSPAKFTLSDQLAFREDNIEAEIHGATDFYSVYNFLQKLASLDPLEPLEGLTSRNLKVANIIMHPVKSVDAFYRMWIHFIDVGNPTPQNPYDAKIFDALKNHFGLTDERDDIFLKALLAQADALTRDMRLCQYFNIHIFQMEEMLTKPAYLQGMLDYLCTGRIQLADDALSDIYSPENQSSYRGLIKDGVQITTPTAAAGPKNEPAVIYQQWPPWRQQAFSIINNIFVLSHAYQDINYDFDFLQSAYRPADLENCNRSWSEKLPDDIATFEDVIEMAAQALWKQKC